MILSERPVTTAPAYRAGAAALLLSVAVILIALAYEYIGGYQPCPLCLMQRYAYYAGIPVLFLALVLVAAGYPRFAALLFGLVALAFLANAGLAGYQAGAEWKFWPGPATCSGAAGLSTNAGGLLKNLQTVHVIRCDEASWRMLGLSFAGWNAIVSLVLAAIAAKAAAGASQA